MGNNITIRLNYSDTQPIRLINPDELHRQYLIITNDDSCELVSAYYHASGHFLCFINDKKPKKDSGAPRKTSDSINDGKKMTAE